MTLTHRITKTFDAAAQNYDDHARVQAQIAKQLAAWALPELPPQTILDIGCGTGFAAEAASKKWPLAQITALDPSPAMLIEAQRKLPKLQIILGDAAHISQVQPYDAIFSSMMLHWLPHPLDTLRNWQTNLKPKGKLYAALLIEGSFQEWRNVCRAKNINDGLWKMPAADFAEGLTTRRERKDFSATYPSARAFLSALKSIGAATPEPGHNPLNPGLMRQLLAAAPKPFTATYRALFIEVSPHAAI